MYFDYLSTTPVDPQVLEVMRVCNEKLWGNPHASDHAYGHEATLAVDAATKSLSALLPTEQKGTWIFTSGATEANNLVLKGIYEKALFSGKTRERNKIFISSIEHPCVLEAARYLKKRGADIFYLPVTNKGVLDLDCFKNELDESVLLVSVMWANNETGVIQPIEDIAALCQSQGTLFHSDAAQAAGKISLEGKAFPDLLSISGHKLYGPKGIGALWVKTGLEDCIEPQIHGGGQQQGYRSGTIPVALCAGLAKGVEIALATMVAESARLKFLRDQFESALRTAFNDFRVNGEDAPRLPHVSHFQIPHVDMGDLLSGCPEYALSRGSACSSEDTTKVSHVLAAMRMEFFAHECLRVSFGRQTTEDEVMALADMLVDIAGRIRA